MNITVIGGGSWGTALAHLLARRGHRVVMLLRDAGLAGEISLRHENTRYMPGRALHPGLAATTDPEKALPGAEICVLAVPCQHMRAALRSLASLVPARAVPVCASKGIEASTLSRMSAVVAEEWPGQAESYAILSGPSFAAEVLDGKPTAVVLGCADPSLGETLREAFSSELFRAYSSTDVTGVELGGAVKNVIAIAAGICDGLDLGHNGRAGLITRGLAEICRLGAAMGARGATFMGLSGLGDLVLTCTGDLSRNRQVGMRLAAGQSLEAIAASMRMVAEGVKTTEAVCALGGILGVELPIAGALFSVLRKGASPADMVRELMTRTLREE